MASTKRHDQKVATRAKVLEAARRCFQARGYDATTIRMVAAAAGTSTGAVFSNFAGKDELYAAAYGNAPLTPEQGRELLAVLSGGTIPEWAGQLVLQEAW